jgi:hypothetical protein
MRMWNVSPKVLCNRHLLGQHVEMHMTLGALKHGKSIQGYVDKGLICPSRIKLFHDATVDVMTKRGMRHSTPMLDKDVPKQSCQLIATINSYKELWKRCPECRKNIQTMIKEQGWLSAF